MQMLVCGNTSVTGPRHFEELLPRAATPARTRNDEWGGSVTIPDFYRDIAVLAFPDAANGVVAREAVLDLTAKLDAGGKLTWDVPPGKWMIRRIGHTTTGMTTRPPVVGGNGLECDKLSREAMDAQF